MREDESNGIYCRRRTPAGDGRGGDNEKSAGRLLFVDNIRVFLTILVMLHHLMIIYAGSGGWLYYEGRQDEIAAALGDWFCAINQSYFYGAVLAHLSLFCTGIVRS